LSAGTDVGIGIVNSPPLKSASQLSCDLLVLGASFTGVEVMHRLRCRGALANLDTIVVDCRQTHGYIPLVHELVAGEVDATTYVLATAQYIRSLPRTSYLVDTVVGLDAQARQVTLASGRCIHARAIIIALGSSVEIPPSLGAARGATSAKFLEQCDELRQRLQTCAPGRLVVVGGGITGVEMAGELAAWSIRTNKGFSVTLLDSHEYLLTQSARAAGRSAEKLLRTLGVEILLRSRVKAIDANRVTITRTLGTGAEGEATTDLDCSLVVWAGGIRPVSVKSEWGVYRGSSGFIEVDTALRCRTRDGETAPGIFAGGDAVRVRDEAGIRPTMQRAIECIWQGGLLARNVEAFLNVPTIDGRTAAPRFSYHTLVRDFPYGISIGPHSLVTYGSWVVNLRALGVAFRRWLMRRYFARYRPRKP
jgi:NADH dehydrogenase